LVSAVVAGFEHGQGAWKAECPHGAAKPLLSVETGRASRGRRWLATKVGNGGGDLILDTFVNAQRLDWSRFGDALRADVCRRPGTTVYAHLYVVGPDGKMIDGPDTAVGDNWSTLVWQAGPALKDVTALGVRWRIHGRWMGTLGLDNVRVGAAAGLSEAWSVAVGPFPNREEAVASIPRLKSAGVDSFPIFVEGWYLNVGTFSTKTAAANESKRLAAGSIATVLIER
jgi:hypothetical protein